MKLTNIGEKQLSNFVVTKLKDKEITVIVCYHNNWFSKLIFKIKFVAN